MPFSADAKNSGIKAVVFPVVYDHRSPERNLLQTFSNNPLISPNEALSLLAIRLGQTDHRLR